MAVQIPPTITAVPTPAIQRNDRATFSNRVDAFVTWLITGVSQFGAVATNVYNNAVDAAASAASALSNKGLSQAAADAAESYRTQAKNSADAAAASATTIGTTAAFSDANPVVKGSGDTTKQLKFEIDGFTTSTTRIVTVPNKSGTMAMLDDGGLVPVAEIILASAVANIDFLNVFSSAYDRYLITFDDLRTSSGASGVQLRLAVAGVPDSTASYSQSSWNNSLGSPTANSIYIGSADAGVSLGVFGAVTLYEVNSSANINKRLCYESLFGTSGNASAQGFSLYARGAGAAGLSGFRFFLATGVNFVAGARVRVYGYKKA